MQQQQQYSAAERDAASKLKELLQDDDASEYDLIPFVKACDGNLQQAARKVTDARKAKSEYKKLTIDKIAEFYRAPPGRKYPDGCVFLLENMQDGTVARDAKGRPVAVSLGMQHGNVQEMQQQFAYVMERLEAHAQSSGIKVHGLCMVVEVRPREKDAPPSFRFPDRDVRTLFDMGRDVYPTTLWSVNHFCGLPRVVTWAFKLVKPFMRREVYESMVLKPSFAHLPSAIPKASMLRRWGGDLDFDIDAWVEWRAAEEGVDASQLCGRGEGRRFDPKVAAAAAEAAMADSLSASDITAQKLLAGEVGSSGRAPRLHGKVDKRGSGRGLFGTVRWKPKYLVVSEVGLVYFDAPDPNDKGKAARVVPLGEEGTRVELRGAGAAAAGTGFHFAVVAPTREFLFSVPTKEGADEWVAAIQAEMDEAQKVQSAMALGSDGGAGDADEATVGATASTMDALNLN